MIADILAAALTPGAATGVCAVLLRATKSPGSPRFFYFGASIGDVIVRLAVGQPVPLALAVANLAIAAFLLWRHRRKDRAPRSCGAKSRALIAALVRRARETALPRPAGLEGAW